MRRVLMYTVVILGLLFSCKVQKADREAIYGTFEALEQKYKGLPTSVYALELKQDGTFSFNIKFDMTSPQCAGEWITVGEKFILLKCDDSDNAYEAISGGYMNEREHKLEILSKNRLKYKDVVLKRNIEI